DSAKKPFSAARSNSAQRRALGSFCQFVFQGLNIDALARTRGSQLAINHDCRNGSNAELFGACKGSGVHNVVDDDLGRRTRLSPHYVNYLMAEGASRAEYFHLALAVRNHDFARTGAHAASYASSMCHTPQARHSKIYRSGRFPNRDVVRASRII